MNTREHLRQEIETTQAGFYKLLDSIPDEAFHQPSDNPAWTIGEVLYHMSIAPRFLVVDARMIANQPWLYHLVMVLVQKRLFDWLNARLTRYGARDLSRQFLANEYNKANGATLRALEAVAEEDFKKSLQYPDFDPLLTGEVTLEYLFGYVKRHFDSHKKQIRSALKKQEKQPPVRGGKGK